MSIPTSGRDESPATARVRRELQLADPLRMDLATATALLDQERAAHEQTRAGLALDDEAPGVLADLTAVVGPGRTEVEIPVRFGAQQVIVAIEIGPQVDAPLRDLSVVVHRSTW